MSTSPVGASSSQPPDAVGGAGPDGAERPAAPLGAAEVGDRTPATAPRVLQVMPRGLVVVLGGAGLVVSVAGIRELGWMIAPVMLALMLVVAVSPVQTWMLRHHLPGWLATTAVLLILYAVLLALVGVLGISVAQLAGLLPGYSDRAGELLTNVQDQLARWGVGADQINSFVGQIDLGRVTVVVTTVLSSLTSTATTLFFLLATLLFMGLDAAGFPDRLQRIAADRPAVVDALSAFARGTRRYLVVSSLFGAICSVLDIIALTWLTVPLPMLWGILAFITNYIPNIGFFVGLVPPALLALLDGGWREMVSVIIAYMLINVLIQTVIQPKFVGDVVGLSVTVTFLATAFWAWALGPLGALLAIPLTLLTKAVLIDVDPRTRWLDILFGSAAGRDRVRAGPGRGRAQPEEQPEGFRERPHPEPRERPHEELPEPQPADGDPAR